MYTPDTNKLINKCNEVITPLSLVTEIIEKIEKFCGDTFFANPDLKILDPTAGIGNIPKVLFDHLMLRLKIRIPNDGERKKHILEKILHINELDEKNFRVCKKIFEGNKYKLHIEHLDFLKKKTVFGDSKFDLIISNPPLSNYNMSDTQIKNNYILNQFVTYSINLLNENGLLSFIHPSGWRKTSAGDSSLFDFMTNTNTMLYLDMHSQHYGSKEFENGYDWYIIKKTVNHIKFTQFDYNIRTSYTMNMHNLHTSCPKLNQVD